MLRRFPLSIDTHADDKLADHRLADDRFRRSENLANLANQVPHPPSPIMLPDLTIEEVYEEFGELEDWSDRYDYLIELGMDMPPLPEDAKTEENRVHGCQSNVWLVAKINQSDDPVVEFHANSDSVLVSGLIAILTALYSGKTPQEIISIDAQEVFIRLGLERHLSAQRRNGLLGMVRRVRELAVETQTES